MNEEQMMIQQSKEEKDVIAVYNEIPYALLSKEVSENGSFNKLMQEFAEITTYYNIYNKGKSFTSEGTNGDYVASNLKFKMAASLINKEARFLFAETPDISVEPKGNVGVTSEEDKKSLTILNDLVKTVLDDNNFEDSLIKAAKDCFIGKRVAGLVNFNEEDGATITFLSSLQFLFETKVGNPKVLTKFVCFELVKDSIDKLEQRYFKKKYTLEDNDVYLEEILYDGNGEIIETITKKQITLLKRIPAVIFLNDGLTSNGNGESEISNLYSFEEYYSKFSNADMDAERKSMNPIRYTVDMDNNSTKDLSSSAGSQWDLGTDQNLEQPKPMVGMLEPAMNYSDALKTTLDRIKTAGYEQVDMPNVSLESMSGAITSGKALKAVYWPLIVRCKEKMKMWGPKLSLLITSLIEGAFEYKNCVNRYVTDDIKEVQFEIHIVQNTPLPEDELEEKNMDLAEVQANTMSRKAYMKKWRNLTDDEVQEELEQIALERQMIEDVSFTGSFGETWQEYEHRQSVDNFRDEVSYNKQGQEPAGYQVNKFGGKQETTIK